VTSPAASARTSEVTTVVASAPLGLVMVTRPDPVGQGEVLTYELTVTNRRQADAANVQARMEIPTGVASCQAFSDGGATTNLCFVGRDVLWSIGTLAGGASRTVQAVFAVAAVPDGTILHTTARTQDGDGARARASARTAVTGAAPLMLGIADNADPVRVGDAV